MFGNYKFPRLSQSPFHQYFSYLFVVLLCISGMQNAFAQQTINDAQLHTWWHANHTLNNSSPVADGNVRRSTVYDVRVRKASALTQAYDSFTYMSIPRSGKAKWGYTHEDGAEFSSSAGLTMSWSSFVYSQNVVIDVSLTDGKVYNSVNEVTVRPTKLNFVKEKINNTTVRIHVPYASSGYRFSVEFDNQLYTAYNDMSGTSGVLTTNSSSGADVHTEPRHALLIFAEPMLTGSEKDRLVPTSAAGSIYYPPTGEVNNLNTVSQNIIYFGPGTYYMPWNYHAVLPANVKWVYLAPGAYVKGAFRFYHDNQGLYKVTGYGALSGEKYVYEADTANGYQHLNHNNPNCHASCVKMLQFQSSSTQQYLDLQGVTIVEPPYHSFVVYGDETKFQMRVDNYKQVGSWFWQTDGVELYRGSSMNNTFFHANDDVLKIYHSNVVIDNTVIWKNENGPVIQWGWTPRNIDNVQVKNTDVIHSRMYWKDTKTNTCIINSSTHWENPGATNKADPNAWTKNILIENTRVEGKANCAIRIYALSSTENIHIKNLAIDGWSNLGAAGVVNKFEKHSNSSGQLVTIGNESVDSKGLKLENFSVGGQMITRAANNWQETALGHLAFSPSLFNNWNAWESGSGNTGCTTQTVTFDPVSSKYLGDTVALNAVASSGLAVTYSVVSGSASLSGSLLTVGQTAGQITVRASQAGNSTYCSALASISFNAVDPNQPPSPMYVAGTFSTWSLQQMSYESGKYVITKTLSTGAHQLKFANTSNWAGQDWGNASGLSGTVQLTTGGGANVTFSVATAGAYIISLNPGTLAYSISMASPPPSPRWVAGTFTGWSLVSMTVQNGIYQYTGTLSAGNHALKFANTANWTGKDWGNASGLSGYAQESTGGLPNLTFSIASSGIYVIKFNTSTLSYSIAPN